MADIEKSYEETDFHAVVHPSYNKDGVPDHKFRDDLSERLDSAYSNGDVICVFYDRKDLDKSLEYVHEELLSAPKVDAFLETESSDIGSERVNSSKGWLRQNSKEKLGDILTREIYEGKVVMHGKFYNRCVAQTATDLLGFNDFDKGDFVKGVGMYDVSHNFKLTDDEIGEQFEFPRLSSVQGWIRNKTFSIM